MIPVTDGGVAQLGEHLPCKQGVMGSIPIISTNLPRGKITSSLFTIHFSLFTKREREVNERAMEEPIPNERENRFVAQVVRAHA